MANLITDHIDIWTSAQTQKTNGAGRGNHSAKHSLHGIKKLRELIMELAVRGKLVPQDSKDEPASVLLEKIAKEKARLIKEGKIRKQEPLLGIGNNEKPFKLPKGWKWTRLGNMSANIHYGYTAAAEHGNSGIRLLRITDIQNDSVNWENVPGCEIEENKTNDYLLENNDILIARTGGTIGKSYLVENIGVRAVFASYLIRIKHIEGAYSSFIKSYLRSQLYWRQLYKNSMGTGQPNVNATALKSLMFPVPPLSEQHRIVTKVDELMALCDQLEQQQTDSNVAHQALVETLLATLTSAAHQDEFIEAWQRIADHFDVLFSTEQSIDQLKQTILQLAVMGKLVTQDPSDEPTSVLLEKIAKERKRLIKEGKIKEQKSLPEISDDEMLVELPMGWAWCLIPQVVINDKYSIKRGPFGSSITKSFFVSAGYKVYEQQHAINDDFSLGNYYIDKEKFNELKAFEVVPNDIIISCSGTVGKVAIAPSWMEPGIINQALLKLSLNQNALTNEYFKILFPTFYMRTETLSELQGTAQKNMVSVDTLKKEPFPLPSISEQHRIVAKVDELMALCDTLKARLNDAQATQVQLADTIVEQAVA
jgi:type I restriction enzyme, S subunit